MTGAPVPVPPSRRAALMTYAMAEADQTWLLHSLAPARRQVLKGLIAELHELGIPPDEALLKQVRDQPAAEIDTATTSMTAPLPTDLRLVSLSGAQILRLAQLLQREPPRLVARLLATDSWNWRGALLAAMEEDFVGQVRAASVPARAPLLEAALCDALMRTLPEPQEADSADPIRRAWRKARALLRLEGRTA